MPWGLKRFQQARDVHFLTFSCYRRKSKFDQRRACEVFLAALERVRASHAVCISGGWPALAFCARVGFPPPP
jgi:putative transposase